MIDRKKEITRVFDSIASQSSWEKLYSGGIDRISYNFITRQRAVEELLMPCVSGLTLDVGCGTGDLVAFYVNKGVMYTGIDLSENMIARANRNYADLVRAGKANFQVADCEKLPFGARAFDVLSAVALIEYFPDPSKVLDEITRVTKGGGYVVLTVPHKLCINNLMRFFMKQVTDLLFPLYCKHKDVSLAAMRTVKHYSYSQSAVDRLMEKRGFRKIDDRYTNFYIIPHPLDHLMPKVYMKVSEKIDRCGLDKLFKSWAANYIAIYRKS